MPAQRLHIRGNDPEILRNQRQLSELVLQHAQQIFSRRMPPLARARIGGGRRHRPVRRQCAKVIEPQQVESLELLVHARAPQMKSVP